MIHVKHRVPFMGEFWIHVKQLVRSKMDSRETNREKELHTRLQLEARQAVQSRVRETVKTAFVEPKSV